MRKCTARYLWKARTSFFFLRCYIQFSPFSKSQLDYTWQSFWCSTQNFSLLGEKTIPKVELHPGNVLLPFSSRSHTVPSAAWPPLSLSQAKENRWWQYSASFKTKRSICGGWSYLFACDEQGRGRVKSPSEFSSSFHPAVWFFLQLYL